MKKRKNQINREIIITSVLYGFYFIWWYYFAYMYVDSEDVKNFKYIFGLPEWFFYSCVVGLVVVNLLVYVLVHFFFKDVSLDEEQDGGSEEKC